MPGKTQPQAEQLEPAIPVAPAVPGSAVAVIVPVGDAAGWAGLARTLESVRGQRPTPAEVIVADALGRPALDAEVAVRLPGARVVRPAPGQCAAAAGLAAAASPLAILLEAGDRWTGQALAALARGFRDAPGIDAVLGLARPPAAETAGPAGARRAPPYPGRQSSALLARRTLLLAAVSGEGGLADPAADLPASLRRRGAALLVVPDVVLESCGPATALAETPLPDAGSAPVAGPRCSVILVVQEGRRYLPAALACLRRQTLAPAEILAVVGASQDGTLAYLAEQPDVRAIAQTGTGLAQARNQALAEARGEAIAFYDHDDLWHPLKLERQLAVLGLFAGPAACIARFRSVRDLDPADPARVTAAADPWPRLGWTPSALLAHRRVFGAVGGFDPATGMGCDTDWFLRLRLSGQPIGVAPEVLLDKRLHAANLSRDNAQNRAALFKVIRKNRADRQGA